VQLALTAAGRVAAGGAVILNAVVADADGNPVREPVEVEFFDDDVAYLAARPRIMASQACNTCSWRVSLSSIA
jgi:hypothetical protein